MGLTDLVVLLSLEYIEVVRACELGRVVPAVEEVFDVEEVDVAASRVPREVIDLVLHQQLPLQRHLEVLLESLPVGAVGQPRRSKQLRKGESRGRVDL